MRALTVTPDQLMPGDKITAVDNCPVPRPDIVLSTPPGWVEGSIKVHYVQGTTHLIFADTPVAVSRPEDYEEKEVIEHQVYKRLLLIAHTHGMVEELDKDLVQLSWLMNYPAPAEGEPPSEAFVASLHAQLDADYDERCTIPPC